MSSHGNKDNAANAPFWAVNSTIVNAENAKIYSSSPTAENVAKLYANTSANVYTNRETIGLFGVDNAEIANTQQRGIPHTGWVLKTTGQGGRAGRVQYETLITLSNLTQDADGTIIANTANP